MKILLQRHGATPGNLRRAYVGAGTDEALSPQGRAELQALPARPEVREVYVGGLLRTRQSAAICYPEARQIVLPELREMEFGRFEGQNWQDLAGDATYRAWVEGGCLAACPEGESRAQFVRRCLAAFQAVLEQQARAEQLHFLIHGGTIRAILSELAQPRRDFFAYNTPPGGSWLCELLPATGAAPHLRVLEAPPGAAL